MEYDRLTTPGFSKRTTRTAIAVVTAIAVGCASEKADFRSARQRALDQAGGSADSSPAGTSLQTMSMFSVHAAPPPGWERKINDAGADERAEHVLWVSPSNRTVFGVLFFKLPFPVGHDLAFRYGFLAEADKREGPVTVVEKYWDDEIGGMRFIVDTRKYRCEAKFFVRGMRGWAAYAGTRRDQPFEMAEHAQAIAARESAEFGEELSPRPATQPAR